ncbi:MAG TPA: FG-GAP repeat protein, partial [Acidobacteriota bacterium]|nr:FG-GAP repeat protein [Acidobacteriota bacterium]
MPAPNRWLFFSRLFVVCGLFLFLSLILRPILSASTPATVVSKSVSQPDEPSLRGEAAIKHLQEQGTYQSLQEAVNRAQYDVLWRDQTPVKGLASGAFEAINQKQKFATWFTDDRIVVHPSHAGVPDWEFQFKFESLGYGATQYPVGPGKVSAELSKVENARLVGGITKLTEWYINRPEGLEQGITIEAPPAQRVPGERMRLGFRVGGDLFPQLEDPSAINFTRRNGSGTALRYDQLYVTDSIGNAVPAQFAVEGGKVWIEVDDAQAVYPINIDPTFALPFKLVGPTPLGAGGSVAVYGNTAVVGTISNRVFVYVQDMAGAWTLQATLTPSDTSTPADFGIDVTIYGNTIAVGAFLQGPGRVYIFNRTGTTWSETQILTNPDLEPGAWFGYSVAMNVDTLAVGSEWSAGPNNNDQGAAFIYVRSGGVWTLQQKLVASDGASGDNLGYEIDIWGDYVVVGAPKNASITSQSGAAYVFVRTGTTWNQQAKLIDPQGNGADLFGVCVSINGDTIAVGSNEGDSATGQVENTGSAVVFVRTGSTWTVQQRFIPPSGSVVPLGFGIGVCVYGNRLVIGSPSEIVGSFTDHGACYVYSRSGSAWTLDSRLIPADGETLSLFGESIAMQGETLVIGSIGDTIGAQQGYGSAYVYSTCDWMQQAKNINADGAASDNLGSSIAVSGSTVIVGAENDDVDAANDNRGSASVFVRSGTTWTRQTVLTASDRANGDFFGTSVAIEGDTAVVGARLGPGGTSADQGAAYVFVRSSGVWSQQARLNGSDSAANDEFGRSVSMSGQTVVVGAPLGPGTNSADQGAAYVFTRSVTTWTQQQKVSAGSDGAAGDQFGLAVDVNLNTAIVGANSDDFPGQANQGSAYVFFRTGTTWAQQQKLSGSDSLANDNFGVSVALSNETAIIGADRDDIGANTDQGSAFVFVRSGSTWSQQQKLTGSDGTANNQFGAGVDIDGERAVIGARFGRNAVPVASGSVYIFGRAENLWFQQKILVANDGAANDEFAGCVALDDNYIACGARADDVGANADQGSSYVFVLECPTCPYLPAVLTGTRTICVGQSAP